MKFTNINYNLYKSFISVYETKNISKAAEQLGLTQPTVSYSIKELEKQLNTQLFNTNPRGVIPTKEAYELYKYVSSAFVMLNNGENAISNFHNLATGTIRLGCPSYIASSILLDFICAFIKKYPQIKLEIHNKLRHENVELLARHDIDLFIDILPIKKPNLDFEIVELKDLQYILISSKKYLTEKGLGTVITETNLENLFFIAPIKYLKEAKNSESELSIIPNLEVTTSELLYRMVQAGLGIGYCEEEYFNVYKDNDVVKLDINIKLPSTRLAVAFNKDTFNRASQTFIEELEEFFNPGSQLNSK